VPRAQCAFRLNASIIVDPNWLEHMAHDRSDFPESVTVLGRGTVDGSRMGLTRTELSLHEVGEQFGGFGVGAPRNNPSVLRSSSTSGQWIPWPPPAISHRWRCSGVALNKRGYHAKGTEMVRPSMRLTVKRSSSTETAFTRSSVLGAEVAMPCLQELCLVGTNQTQQFPVFSLRSQYCALLTFAILSRLFKPSAVVTALTISIKREHEQAYLFVLIES
jgi:hypothetical protein